VGYAHHRLRHPLRLVLKRNLPVSQPRGENAGYVALHCIQVKLDLVGSFSVVSVYNYLGYRPSINEPGV